MSPAPYSGTIGKKITDGNTGDWNWAKNYGDSDVMTYYNSSNTISTPANYTNLATALESK